MEKFFEFLNFFAACASAMLSVFMVVTVFTAGTLMPLCFAIPIGCLSRFMFKMMRED